MDIGVRIYMLYDSDFRQNIITRSQPRIMYILATILVHGLEPIHKVRIPVNSKATTILYITAF